MREIVYTPDEGDRQWRPTVLATVGRISLMAWEVPAEREEPWRRFLQELSGSRQEAYADSRRRLGVSAESVWLAPKRSGGGVAVVFFAAEDRERVLRELGASEAPFDSWYRREMREVFGCDFARLAQSAGGELLFSWREASDEGNQESRNGS